jgi:ATP-dependent RNA helicase DeaD
MWYHAPMETFSDLFCDSASGGHGLSEPLARAIEEMGFTKPSPIQAQALPILTSDATDFIGLAATGTGKTAAFAIPVLQKLDPKKKMVQAIILCPTRELCMQVAGQVNLLGKYLGIRALPIYGGAGYEEQIRGLRSGDQIVVGTPGRVIDHLERGTLKIENVATIILDEADEMISMGFREDMETIMSKVPRETSNIWLFSATMSGPVRKVADEFLRSPKTVQVNRTEMLSSTVEQYYYMVREKDKPEILCKLVDAAEDFYGVVFCQTKSLVADLGRYLTDRGYKADCLHGDMSQGAREQVMAKFRTKKLRILVGTDVAARGIDVKDMTHVINYSIPRELDTYVHRIGRTARSGKAGFAMSLVTPTHRHLLGKIEKMTKSRILEGVVPSRKVIGIKKLGNALSLLMEQNTYPRAVELMNDAWKETITSMTGEEIAARFLTLMHPEVFMEARAEMTREARPELEREKRRQSDSNARGDRPYRPRADRGERPYRDRPREDREFKPRFDREEKRDFKPRFERPAEGDQKRDFKPRFDRAESRDSKPRFDRAEEHDSKPRFKAADSRDENRPFKKFDREDRPFKKFEREERGSYEKRDAKPKFERSEDRSERPDFSAKSFSKPRVDKYASKRREVSPVGGGFKPRKELAREAKERGGKESIPALTHTKKGADGNHPPRRSKH